MEEEEKEEEEEEEEEVVGEILPLPLRTTPLIMPRLILLLLSVDTSSEPGVLKSKYFSAASGPDTVNPVMPMLIVPMHSLL